MKLFHLVPSWTSRFRQFPLMVTLLQLSQFENTRKVSIENASALSKVWCWTLASNALYCKQFQDPCYRTFQNRLFPFWLARFIGIPISHTHRVTCLPNKSPRHIRLFEVAVKVTLAISLLSRLQTTPLKRFVYTHSHTPHASRYGSRIRRRSAIMKEQKAKLAERIRALHPQSQPHTKCKHRRRNGIL
jgi:hypothetical protein